MVQIESRKMDDSDKMLYWGSWEELVLGGAVLRHGTRSWDAVAAELRSRTFYPYFFTPEVCKARYQDLQKRYSGCAACFEELRKQRVAELKRELEKSDGSIGSLESKLESLKSEKNENRSGDYPSGQTESPPSVGNIARVDFPLKDTSKDGLSAGSFTEETQTDSSPASRIPPTLTGIKPEEGENATSKENIVRKRRGKRKRKEVISEVGFRDNKDLVRSVVKEETTENSERAVRCSNDGDQMAREENVDLMSVLNSIIESENLSVFQRRTDSQRRGRYKKTIRRHMDLNMMKNDILEGRITTARELYRDLLLLCNNGIVFYSKESREYKSAFSLRNYVKKHYWENIKVLNPCCSLPLRLCCPPPPPAVPKRVHSFGGGPKVGKTVNEVSTSQNRESKKGCGGGASPMESKEVEEEKKRVDQPVKVARSGGSKRVETPVSGRKKPRKK